MAIINNSIKNKNIYDLIIIGGGPAGITAGIYAARQKIKTLLITKAFGGQISRKSVEIENWPGNEKISGPSLVKNFETHLKKQKIDIEINEVKKIEKINNSFLIHTKLKKIFKSKTAIIASGANPKPLEIPGEKEFIGRGVSYCTICDAPLFSGKKVAVIGGGNAGFEAAIALSKWAKEVCILEYGNKIKADSENQERIKKIKKIKIIMNVRPKEIKGKNFVNSLIYLDRKIKKENELAVEGVFIEIGSQPATSFVRGLVKFNEKNEIKIDPFSGKTSCPGLFAAGDVNNLPFKQIIIAAGEGAKATMSVYEYLQN